jgi:hypothetical protein
MSEKIITKCRICGKLMSRYSMQVYPGDETCCSTCNKEAEDNEPKYRQIDAYKDSK